MLKTQSRPLTEPGFAGIVSESRCHRVSHVPEVEAEVETADETLIDVTIEDQEGVPEDDVTGEVAAVRVVAGVAVLPPTVRCHEADPDQHRRRLDEGDPGPDQDPIK